MSRERVVTVLMNAGVKVKGYEAVTLYDALSAANLLLDERAQACVEACKAYRKRWGPLFGTLDANSADAEARAIIDAGAAYDAPKPAASVFGVKIITPSGYDGPTIMFTEQQSRDVLAALAREREKRS